MSPSFQDFHDEYELWTVHGRREDPWPMARAAVAHFRSGTCLTSEAAACLAAVAFALRFGPCHGRWVFFFLAWFIRSFVWRAWRPMWNDYHMALWQLSRNSADAEALRRHLDWAAGKLQSGKARYEPMISSGIWMIASVCKQDAEFKRQWENSLGAAQNRARSA